MKKMREMRESEKNEKSEKFEKNARNPRTPVSVHVLANLEILGCQGSGNCFGFFEISWILGF